jgi:protein-arginine kinase activator protein McsA
MKCQWCLERPAEFHITVERDGFKTTEDLCTKCFEEEMVIHAGAPFIFCKHSHQMAGLV